MTEEDEEDFIIKNICRFCEKNTESDKVRDQCRLTGKYTGPAHKKYTFNVTQCQAFLFQTYLTISVIMIVIYFF